MSEANRRLAYLLCGLASALGIVLLVAGAPLWAFYLAPLLTVPFVLAGQLTVGKLNRARAALNPNPEED